MSTLKKRLLISSVLVTITIVSIFFAPRWFFFLVIELLALLGFNEYLDLCERKGIQTPRILGLVLAALLPFTVFLSSEAVLLATACLILFVFNFQRRFKNQALLSTALVIFGMVYVVWFFAHLLKLHLLPGGAVWVFYTVLLVKGGDAGAYFVGRKIGKTKLIEHISPQKSVEGALGGFSLTLILSIISKIYLIHVSFLHLLVLGIMIGALAQLGDLAESLLKRDAGVKDSGHMPGLGGILDILDSLLLTAPFIYYYVTTFALIKG